MVFLHFRYNCTVNLHPIFLKLFATLYGRCRKALKQYLSCSKSESKDRGKTPNEAEKIPIKAADKFHCENP